MKWSNLKKNKCPKCNKDFTWGGFENPKIITCGCGFAIREKRFSEIVNSQINAQIEEELEDEYRQGGAGDPGILGD